MSTEWLRPRTEPVKGWRYLAGETRPAWIARATHFADDGALLLERDTGPQEVKIGEWVIQRLDGEMLWYTDAMRHRDFE